MRYAAYAVHQASSASIYLQRRSIRAAGYECTDCVAFQWLTCAVDSNKFSLS